MSTILPLELVDKAIGSRIHILMKTNQEFIGTLSGFDDFVNVVLTNVVFIQDGKQEKLDNILLNGSNICMLIPGASG